MRLTGKTSRFLVWYTGWGVTQKHQREPSSPTFLVPGQLAHSAPAPPDGPAKFCKDNPPVKWRSSPEEFLVCRATPLASERLLSLALGGTVIGYVLGKPGLWSEYQGWLLVWAGSWWTSENESRLSSCPDNRVYNSLLRSPSTSTI